MKVDIKELNDKSEYPDIPSEWMDDHDIKILHYRIFPTHRSLAAKLT